MLDSERSTFLSRKILVENLKSDSEKVQGRLLSSQQNARIINIQTSQRRPDISYLVGSSPENEVENIMKFSSPYFLVAVLLFIAASVPSVEGVKGLRARFQEMEVNELPTTNENRRLSEKGEKGDGSDKGSGESESSGDGKSSKEGEGPKKRDRRLSEKGEEGKSGKGEGSGESEKSGKGDEGPPKKGGGRRF